MAILPTTTDSSLPEQSTLPNKNGGIPWTWSELGKMCRDHFDSDLNIIVGNVCIKSHKWFLNARSKVLARIIKQQAKNNVVSLPDVDPVAFVILHEFMYADHFPKDKVYNDETILTVLQLANRYFSDSDIFEETCHKMLEGRVREDNVYTFYSVARTLKLVALEEIFGDYIIKVI